MASCTAARNSYTTEAFAWESQATCCHLCTHWSLLRVGPMPGPRDAEMPRRPPLLGAHTDAELDSRGLSCEDLGLVGALGTGGR